MRTKFYAILGVLSAALYMLYFCAVTTAHAQTKNETKIVLRVMSYNIRHGQGMDNAIKLERTANAIKEWKPDLVALQEVDRNTRRSGKTDQTKLLTEHLGMYGVFGKTISLQGGDYGLAILSRFPIREYKMVLLPPKIQQEQRGLLIAKIGIPDAGIPNEDSKIPDSKIICFACTHLSVASQAERQVQGNKINDLLSLVNEPVILAGDFNAKPTNNVIIRLLPNWIDTAVPAYENNVIPVRQARIDYIFLRKQDTFDVWESRTINDTMTSDHMPILSIISF